MPPNLGGFFMVRSYDPSECHADYFDFERIEARKPAIEACGISTLSQSPMLGFHKQMDNRIFFFSSRRRHTMCLSDWSSDVCSSDLTYERTEIADITKLVRDSIQEFAVTTGIALINTLHTTCAVFINEFQSALIDDLKGLMEGLVPERGGYRHDDPRVSDCERGNAHSHLRAALLGRDRKSTRLNSSHLGISYAVFC